MALPSCLEGKAILFFHEPKVESWLALIQLILNHATPLDDDASDGQCRSEDNE